MFTFAIIMAALIAGFGILATVISAVMDLTVFAGMEDEVDDYGIE